MVDSISGGDRNELSAEKKPHKVVQEESSHGSHSPQFEYHSSTEPPPGYTFVPLGVQALTEHCKKATRSMNLKFYIVHDAPKNRSTRHFRSVQKGLNRIGYHFPSQIFVRSTTPAAAPSSFDTYAVDLTLPPRQQAFQMIQELFPEMPSADASAVMHHAFKEGTKRVGNAVNLTLSRRVQLAVGAHVRHMHTPYDILLRKGWARESARQQIEAEVFGQLSKWRDEPLDAEMMQTFKEIIVLDDDDEDEDDDDEYEVPEISTHGSRNFKPQPSSLKLGTSDKPIEIQDHDTPRKHPGTSQGQPVILESAAMASADNRMTTRSSYGNSSIGGTSVSSQKIVESIGHLRESKTDSPNLGTKRKARDVIDLTSATSSDGFYDQPLQKPPYLTRSAALIGCPGRRPKPAVHREPNTEGPYSSTRRSNALSVKSQLPGTSTAPANTMKRLGTQSYPQSKSEAFADPNSMLSPLESDIPHRSFDQHSSSYLDFGSASQNTGFNQRTTRKSVDSVHQMRNATNSSDVSLRTKAHARASDAIPFLYPNSAAGQPFHPSPSWQSGSTFDNAR